MEVALVSLAERVQALEQDASFQCGPSDGRPTTSVEGAARVLVAETLRELKLLRAHLILSSSRYEAIVTELEGVETENRKLKYQVSHLKRALQGVPVNEP